MGEHEIHSQPKAYECFVPATRFFLLADHIIEKDGELSDDGPQEGLRVATWVSTHDGNKCRLECYPAGSLEDLKTVYILSEVATINNKPHTVRWALVASESDTSSVMLINNHDNEIHLQPQARKNMIRKALNILAYKAPEESRGVLKNAFDKGFEDVVGNFILSDYAVEGYKYNLDRLAVDAAVAAFSDRLEEIKNDEIQIAKAREPDEKHPQPHFGETVEDVAKNSRESDGKNRYNHVMAHVAALRVSGDIGQKWEHTVDAIDKYKLSSTDTGEAA
jgi:hypothetical protein